MQDRQIGDELQVMYSSQRYFAPAKNRIKSLQPASKDAQILHPYFLNVSPQSGSSPMPSKPTMFMVSGS